MLNKPAIIEYDKYKFMILSAPDDNSLNYWIEVYKLILNNKSFLLQQFKAFNVSDIVRLCERTYSNDLIEQNEIRSHVI